MTKLRYTDYKALGSQMGSIINRQTDNLTNQIVAKIYNAKREIAQKKGLQNENIEILKKEYKIQQLVNELDEYKHENSILQDKVVKQNVTIKHLTEYVSELEKEKEYFTKRIKKIKMQGPLDNPLEKYQEKEMQPLKLSPLNLKNISSKYHYAETPNEHLRIEIAKRDKQIHQCKTKLNVHLSDQLDLLDIFRSCVKETRKEWERRKIRLTKSDKL